jgi:hypothetical protein
MRPRSHLLCLRSPLSYGPGLFCSPAFSTSPGKRRHWFFNFRVEIEIVPRVVLRFSSRFSVLPWGSAATKLVSSLRDCNRANVDAICHSCTFKSQCLGCHHSRTILNLFSSALDLTTGSLICCSRTRSPEMNRTKIPWAPGQPDTFSK